MTDTTAPTNPAGETVWLTDLLPDTGHAVHAILECVAEEMSFDESFSEALKGWTQALRGAFKMKPDLVPLLENEAVRRVTAAAGHTPSGLLDPPDHAMIAAIDAQPAPVRQALIDRALHHLRLTPAPTGALARSAALTTSVPAPVSGTAPTTVATTTPTATAARRTAHRAP
ncbi:hypothetical protein [Streptomyces sp. SID3343]|uniref:hypothetical protein n=1 Tax=Streptomyces sp. SID3343 TaxID=2690260 RepID=UPI001368B2D1|nr:hypothetical protein [Streptomyces sp. SID3343]MYW03353.1 hypothetical protein [Streptomyces sp. SID3343]MYW06241.1 hypothetical protein [Streptomyces sp. SID3343]